MTTVAVLYCDPRGPYPRMVRENAFDTYDEDRPIGWISPREDGLTIDCWDETRDARRYDGPFPVVARPPCKHWGRLKHKAHVKCGFPPCGWTGSSIDLLSGRCPACGSDFVSDAACAPRAVEQVRRWGGVLEHPAGSKLWEHCGLPAPGEPAIEDDGRTAGLFPRYTIEVSQVEWGHVARKRTWLYLVGVPCEVVQRELDARPFPGREPTHWCSGGGTGRGKPPPGVKIASAQQRRRTPPLFAEMLVRLARAAGEARRP